MSKDVLKWQTFQDAAAASKMGVQAIAGLTGTSAQAFFSSLKTLVDSRLSGVKYEGGSPQTFQKYLNFKGNVSVADNLAAEATDITILEQDFRWMGVWSGAGVAYLQDDFVTHLGNMYRSRTSHTSAAGSPPDTNTVDWEIAVTKGADGAGPGGAHANTHKGDGSDPIASATSSVDGLMDSADKAKLDGIQASAKNVHNDLTGLTTGDPHTQYAKADGTRLKLATSVSTPETNQVRLNGSIFERWTGTAWTTVLADRNPSAPLGVDSTDMATNHTVVIHVANAAARPATAVEGQLIYQLDVNLFYKNVAVSGTPVWQALVPELTTYTPAWANQTGAGAVFAAWGDGNPNTVVMHNSRNILATYPRPNDMRVNPRLVKFRLPKALVVDSLSFFPRSSTATALFRLAIFRVSDGVKLYESAFVSLPTANVWQSITGVSISLAANTDYWMCASSNSTATGQLFYSWQTPFGVENFYSGASPLDGRSIGIPEMRELPNLAAPYTLPADLDTLGALQAPDWGATGTVPFVLLNGSAS